MTEQYDKFAIDLIRSGVKQEGLAGLYRGIIESIDDPDRLGRVRVRIFAMHGDKLRTATTALPWAEVSEIGGGGYDFGSFNPPPVGATVFVMFEMGRANHPVVMGTWRGIPKRDEDNPHVMLTNDNEPQSEKTWKPPDEDIETPKDVFDGVASSDPHPTRRVWQKSYKGHTFVVEDGDGKEFLKIIDRAGQIIVMDCPVDKEFGQANASQRGARDAMRGDQLPHRIMKQRRASIRIRDLSGQELLLDAADQSERVVLRSKTQGSANENKIILSSGKGKEFCEMRDSAGNFIRLDPNSDRPIQLQDKSGNAIYTDREKGQVCIVASKEQVSRIPRENKLVQGLKKSEIRGDEQKRIHGNKKTDIVGDAAIGILNNVAANVGGALQLVIANGPIPVPTSDALDIVIPAGSVHINCKVGNLLFDTLAGNIEMSTIAGDIDLVTLLGSVEVGVTTPGKRASTKYGVAGTIDSSALLTHDIDGQLVRLGGLSAINPLIKTQAFIPAWLIPTQTLGAAGVSAAGIAGGFPNPASNAAAIAILGSALQAYASAMASILNTALPAYFSTKAFSS